MQFCRLPILLTVLLTGLITGCGEESAPPAQGDPGRGFIVAVNEPLQYFAQRLIGDDIEVRTLAPADTDPAQWQPSVDEILQLQNAELVLLNGAGYSSWLNKVSLSDNKLVITSEAARDQWIELQGEVTHSHGPEGSHAHGGYAFTTWMDMALAETQARSIAQALQRHWPERKPDINSKLASLVADIEVVDRDYRAAADRLKSRQLVYSHPVYQYFERRYDLPGPSLHWEPDLMPDEDQWRELQGLVSEDTLFIWEAQPFAEISGRMQAMDIDYVIIDPAANRQAQDWLNIQRENAARLSNAGRP